jgi:hypothetical protein
LLNVLLQIANKLGLSKKKKKLPTPIQEFRNRITHALQAITADRLHRVWDEFDYRVDVCRVTKGAHIEGV